MLALIMGKIRKKILPFRDLQRFIDKGLCPHEFENHHSSCTKSYETKFLYYIKF